jgi:hypothetical protein
VACRGIIPDVAHTVHVAVGVNVMQSTPAKSTQIGIIDQILIGMSINAFIFALTQPVLIHNSPDRAQWSYGFHVLWGAFVPTFYYPSQFYFPMLLYPAWYANVLGLTALVLTATDYRNRAWIFSLAAFLLALLPLARFTPHSVGTLGLGYSLWVGCWLCLGLANLHQRIRS